MKTPPLSDLDKLRTALIKNLEHLFGSSKEVDGRIEFENSSLKDIASTISIDPSSLSRLLKSLDLKEPQRPGRSVYEKRITQTRLLAALTKRLPPQVEKPGLKPYIIGGIIGLILGIIAMLILPNESVSDTPQPLVPLAITKASQVRDIMERNSLLITNQLVTGAYEENLELERKTDPNGLSDNLKVQSMSDMQTAVSVIMKGQRDGLRKVNYQIGGSKNLVDFIDENFPTDRLFRCAPEVLALASSLPDSASSFDRSLFNMRTLIFDPEARFEDFNRQITEASKIVQNKMRDQYLSEVDCYLNTGGSCDENLPFRELTLPVLKDELHEPRLSISQQKAVFDLYSKLIRYRITHDLLLLNYAIKTGEYGVEKEAMIGELVTRIESFVQGSRRSLATAGIRNQEGILLADIYIQHSNNEAERNLMEMLDQLTSKSISLDELSRNVLERVRSIQHQNEKNFYPDIR